MKNSKLNISDKKFPDEYLEKSQNLIDEYEKTLDNYRKQLTTFKGRVERMSSVQKKLTIKLRQDIAELIKEYDLDN